MSDFSTEHLLDWKDKARTQGLRHPESVSFPLSVGEQFRKRAIANMVPPPFSKVLCLAACEVVKQEVSQRELDRNSSWTYRMPPRGRGKRSD